MMLRMVLSLPTKIITSHNLPLSRPHTRTHTHSLTHEFTLSLSQAVAPAGGAAELAPLSDCISLWPLFVFNFITIRCANFITI